MIKTLGHVTDPRSVIDAQPAGLVHFTFTHIPTYASDTSEIELQVLYERMAESHYISIFRQPVTDRQLQQNQHLLDIAREQDLPLLDLDSAWPLETLRIPKPWGAEIWYTGIEARGVCQASGIPLPWLLETLPASVVGSARNGAPLLLKILDPQPEPNLGDLYFELHDQKIEVYIVTHVDSNAWPDRVGKIRYGFNQSKLSDFASEAEFKQAYLVAVEAYQSCREEIDGLLDEHKLAAGLSPNDPVEPHLMSQWLALVPSSLAAQEQQLRTEMEGFTHFRDLRVGDVVKVEPFFPHSLQHGVRVIEFQTASYERYILSFGQKVLTQSHWDTESALAQAITAMPPEEDFANIEAPTGVTMEVIADFSAFMAVRMTVTRDGRFTLPELTDYRLLICASGSITVGRRTLVAEDACLIPASGPEQLRTCESQPGCVCIIAIPKQP